MRFSCPTRFARSPLELTQDQSQRHLGRGAETTQSSVPLWRRFRTFELELLPRWRSWIFFVGMGLVAVLLGGEVLRTAFVEMLGESLQVGPLQRAVALDPSNPELHHRLGMILCGSFGEIDRTEGLKHLRRATELNPLVGGYWSDLAWICELSNDTACATHAVEQAVKLSPATPQVHWAAANTFLRTGQRAAAMAEFRRLLELDPTYAQATFHICVGSLGDPQIILHEVLPPGKDPRLKIAYLDFLITNELDDQARQVWAQAVGTGTPIPLPLAEPYLEHLLSLGQGEEAQGVWRDLEKLGVVSNPGKDQEGNLIFNGDFEQTPSNSGLDWRDPPGRSIAVDLEDQAAYSGQRCVRVDFTVSRNEEHLLLYQLVPVVPSQAYLLTAYGRSQDITSDSGPRLQVLDPLHWTVPQVESQTTVGTTSWHQISLKFCTGPATKLVRVALMRERGRTFPTEITGSFWLDTVVLKLLGPASESVCTASDQ